MINKNESTDVSVRSAMIPWFRVRPTSKRWFLKRVHVTMNLDRLPPFPPMRVLEVYGHMLSVSCVKWPLEMEHSSSRNNQLKSINSQKIPIILDETMECASN